MFSEIQNYKKKLIKALSSKKNSKTKREKKIAIEEVYVYSIS